MDDLPFLLVHGSLVWTSALVALAVLVIGAVFGARIALARRRLRAAMRSLRADHGSLRGVLRGGSAITATFEHDANHTSIVHGCEGELWLETADRRIALDGPLTVIGGSRAAARRGTLPRFARDTIEVPDRFRHAVAVMVRDGDQVIVRGEPRPSAGPREVGHREADIAWSITSGSPRGSVEIAAVTPRAPRLPLGVVRLALLAGATLLAGHWIEDSIASSYRNDCIDLVPSSSDKPFELGNGHACVIAASYDGGGLRHLGQLLREHPSRDPVTLRTYDAIGRLADDCKTRLYWMRNDQRFEALVDEARLCGDRRLESEALLALGRFDDAATIHVPAEQLDPNIVGQLVEAKIWKPDELPYVPLESELPSIDTLIAAGRWTEAAARATTDAAALDPVSGLYKRCVAQLLAFRGGNPAALDTLRSLVREPDGAMCEVILAQIDPAARERWRATKNGPATAAERVLRFAAGVGDDNSHYGGSPAQLLVTPEQAFDGALVWLPIEAVGSPARDAAALRWGAASLVVHGRLDAALTLATTTLDLPDDPATEHEDTLALLPAIRLHTSNTELVVPPGPDFMQAWARIRMRSGQGGEDRVSPFEDFKRAAYQARDGDGEPILRFLRGRNPWFEDGDVMALLPRLRSHRAEIAVALAEVPSRSLDGTRSPVRGALGAFARREVLALAGARDAAARWDAIFKRFDAVLRDRDRLVALMLWEM